MNKIIPIESSTIKRIALTLYAFLILSACASGGCDKKTSAEKGVMEPMKTYYIGRFSIDIPAFMEQNIRLAKLRYVKIEEVSWPIDKTSEQARTAEWEEFMARDKQDQAAQG